MCAIISIDRLRIEVFGNCTALFIATSIVRCFFVDFYFVQIFKLKGCCATNRISKDKYYLNIAKTVSQRSTCIRRQYGAVIVKNDEIVSTGYNGAPRGHESCLECGKCWRSENNIPHGSSYEMCKSVHAEQNAIISASRSEMIGSKMYLAGYENGVELLNPEPCVICSRMIVNAGIDCVITESGELSPWELSMTNQK